MSYHIAALLIEALCYNAGRLQAKLT
jgi:hypothetical protein